MTTAEISTSDSSPTFFRASAEPGDEQSRKRSRPPRRLRLLRPSIAHRVFLVGAIPILAAVLIGIASLFLLNRADDARRGALTVAMVYRQVVTAMSEQEAFIRASPAARINERTQFRTAMAAASQGLKELIATTDTAAHRASILASEAWLQRFQAGLGELELAIERNDRLVATMRERLTGLLQLAEAARSRQQESNADIVATLRRNDVELRRAQELVRSAEAARAAIVYRELDDVESAAGADEAISAVRLKNAAAVILQGLVNADLSAAAADFRSLVAGYETRGDPGPLLGWLERRVKIDGTAARALQERAAELLAYTVEAHETEQATQNIAVEAMRLTERAEEAIASHDIPAIGAALSASRLLSDRIAALPISPLIQTEMLDALDTWRTGLTETSDGLDRQNRILEGMAGIASSLVEGVSNLNEELARNADKIGATARRILFLGAIFGLLAGAVFAFLVARSITRPLKRLEHDMLDRAVNSDAGPLLGRRRLDEIGHMAQATNHFLIELGKREHALRTEKDRTERALTELQRTQRELIQSEKLASLGQLVAGVAHEINTPLGIALTTSTVMRDEVRTFGIESRAGRLTRIAFDRFVERLEEGIRLTTANLERSAQLVVSFKQVAADQASGERRTFDLKTFLDDLFISLKPLGKRTGHTIVVDCPEGIEMLSFPGALAQILTNLVTNAYTHAFDANERGTIRIEAARAGADDVSIVFSDDGRGIDHGHRARIFDPFFTTGRARGSTGLGLHIVFNLVTGSLGGTIDVASDPGHGTRFTMVVPRRRSEPVQAEISFDAARKP